MPEAAKATVIDMIRRIPEDATVADTMHASYLHQKIEVGLRQLDESRTLTPEEVEARLSP